jgi:hypothetical protein
MPDRQGIIKSDLPNYRGEIIVVVYVDIVAPELIATSSARELSSSANPAATSVQPVVVSKVSKSLKLHGTQTPDEETRILSKRMASSASKSRLKTEMMASEKR